MNSDISSYRHWRFELDQAGIAQLTFDRADSSTNSLSREVLDELDSLLTRLEAMSTAKAVVIRSGKRSGFIAGADVHEFTGISTIEEALLLIRRGQGILARIEALGVPTVALIHGFCLGADWNWPWPAATASPATIRAPVWVSPRSCSVFIPVLAGRCARSGWSARWPLWK
ncbi:MAG: enoyl-CoA hydratase/isomerase family protein [Desulfuromonadales bacterium]|nr:enoyl-CoA hydratase/isomerase family protein [Desulfuromonadales bacterium]